MYAARAHVEQCDAHHHSMEYSYASSPHACKYADELRHDREMQSLEGGECVEDDGDDDDDDRERLRRPTTGDKVGVMLMVVVVVGKCSV